MAATTGCRFSAWSARLATRSDSDASRWIGGRSAPVSQRFMTNSLDKEEIRERRSGEHLPEEPEGRQRGANRADQGRGFPPFHPKVGLVVLHEGVEVGADALVG